MRSHFIVSSYKESTFVITFTLDPNYLRVVDQVWGFINDKVLRVSCDTPEMLHQDNFKSLPQWVLITGMTKTMWAREVVSTIISTLGVPLEAEHFFSKWEHALRACVMIDYTHLPTTIPAITVRGGLEKINHLKVWYRSFLPACGTCLCFGDLEDQCYLLNHPKSVPKILDVRRKNSPMASCCRH